MMQRYGTNAEGEMERESVRRMLTDLNGGDPPKESALDWVMAEAAAMPLSPGISAPELIKVMSLWYTKDLGHKRASRDEDRAQPKRSSRDEDRTQPSARGPVPIPDGGPSAGAPAGRRRAPLAEAGGCGPGRCCVA